MKRIKILTVAALVASYVAGPISLLAAEPKAKEAGAPSSQKTCPVSDEKLGEMGDPFVFTYKGQEVKLCCKSCKKDFDKDPAKFVKKMEAAKKETKK